MEVVVRPDAGSATDLVARLIQRAVRQKPDLTLGLATGRTMEALYSKLVEDHAQGGTDYSCVTTFNLDEYIGLPPSHECSYRTYMQRHLFNSVNIRPENTHVPDGMAENTEVACARYEAMIATAGGIDLQLLGIGRTGHIGFNEPLSAMFSRTRAKALTPETMAQNRPLFPDPAMMPHRAITMGVGTILDAKRCLLLVTGAEKSGVVARAIEGPVTSMVSATALQMHPHCTVVLDEAAADGLSQKDYYYWLFENEPEWSEFR